MAYTNVSGVPETVPSPPKASPVRGEAFNSEILNRSVYHLALVSTTRPAMCRWFSSSPLMTIS